MQKGLGLGLRVGGTLSAALGRRRALNIVRKERMAESSVYPSQGIRLGMASLPKRQATM